MKTIEDPEFALRYWPVRDAVLALSAHYKRRPGAPAPAIIVLVPDIDDESGVRWLLDGFDVLVTSTIARTPSGWHEAVVIVGGGNFERETLAPRTRGPILLFP